MENLVQNRIEGYGGQFEGLPQAVIIISTQKSLKQATTGFPIVVIGFHVATTRCPRLLQETQLKVVEGREGERKFWEDV